MSNIKKPGVNLGAWERSAVPVSYKTPFKEYFVGLLYIFASA
jgi:hypothetical protein